MDIGGSRFRLGLFAEDGARRSLFEAETLRSGGRDWMLAQLLERGRALLAEAPAAVEACGISFGGPVDFERQSVTSLRTPGWKDFELARWAQENFGIPARVLNDAKAGAWGEFRYGAGRGKNSLVYITLSTGIGAGLVLNGELVFGKDGLAGEIGHLPLLDGGPKCDCGGRGCLETLSSGRAIELRAQALACRQPETLARVIQLSGGDVSRITAKAVFEAAMQKEEGALFIAREATRWLARGLMAAIRLFNPDVIVLGGGVSQAGEGLMQPLSKALDDLAAPSLPYSTEIVLTPLGNYSPLLGAAAIAWDLTRAAQYPIS